MYLRSGRLRVRRDTGGADEASGGGGVAFAAGDGAGLFSDLDRHDVRRKVGVITRAEIVGRNVELGGYLFARDFPEIVEEIAKSRRGSDRSQEFRVVADGVWSIVRDARGAVDRAIRSCWLKDAVAGSSLRAAAEQILSLSASV